MTNIKLFEKEHLRSGPAADEKLKYTQSSGKKGGGTDHHLSTPGEDTVGNRSRSRRIEQIALVDLGGLTGINLEKLAKKLNSLQHLLHFVSVTPPVTDLGKFDLLHCHSYEVLFNFIKTRLKGTRISFGIGITHELLDQHRFNRHHEREGVGVVTVKDATDYMPLGKTLEQYLCYLILCEALCLVGKQDFEHPEQMYCLFDLCCEKGDFIRCLVHPRICEDCETRLKNAGFSDADIEQAKRILAYVGNPNLSSLFKETISQPFIGFLVGGLLIGILSELVAAFPTWWVVGILGFLLLCISGYMYIRYRKAHGRH